jgi:hypothetical protein
MCKDKDALTIPTQLKALKDSTIISPVDKFSPSPYGLKDLAQEFSMLERKKPRDIVIEEVNIIHSIFCTFFYCSSSIRSVNQSNQTHCEYCCIISEFDFDTIHFEHFKNFEFCDNY